MPLDKRLLLCCAILWQLLGHVSLISLAQPPFICGVDVSFLQQIEDVDGYFYDADGNRVDALAYLASQGANYVRLRLWHNPTQGYNNLDHTLAMASRIKALGMRFLLDFHYSDTWADPANQHKPQAWEGLRFAELRMALYDYTVATLQALNAQGTPPDMVQIGNEITSGMLWDDGRVQGETNWLGLISLLNAGARAIRDTVPHAQIMVHIDSGGNRAVSQWFFDHIADAVTFDIIGLSYYPWWAGTFTDLQANLDLLARRYGKPIIIVETAYPWTLAWSDHTHNLVGEENQLLPAYPATPSGQHDFLEHLIAHIQQTPHGLGYGFFYWEPVAIAAAGFGSVWENMAQFDFDGRALPSVRVYGMCAS